MWETLAGPPGDWGTVPLYRWLHKVWRLRLYRRARRFATLREVHEVDRWLNAIRRVA
jgi:hypothetical protein